MALFTRTVPARHAAVLYRHGAFREVLASGRHPRRWGTTAELVDLRARVLPLATQEIPTAEGLTVKVTLSLRVEVADPRAHLENAQDPEEVLYLAAQVVLRETVAALTIEQLVQRRDLPVDMMHTQLEETARVVGLTVLEVVIKDVVMPAELRRTAVELATAAAEGRVQLERARAETATLRSLANAARLLEQHPALERMRLVQEAGHTGQVVLHLGQTPAHPDPRS